MNKVSHISSAQRKQWLKFLTVMWIVVWAIVLAIRVFSPSVFQQLRDPQLANWYLILALPGGAGLYYWEWTLIKKIEQQGK
jgi:hypothetical protein